jgi:acylphosphatase
MLQTMISLQVLYEGNVQGVGFRWSVRHIATGFDITGWIRNLADGRVELQVGGDEPEVFAFLDAIKNSELASHIRGQQQTRLGAPPNARGFEIRQ